MKWAFVILNYSAPEATICAAESVRLNIMNTSSPKDQFNIILVDNGSADDSDSILSAYAHDKETVHFINSDVNLGFSRGNNLGILFARNHLYSDFVVVMNNDVLIHQSDFTSLIQAEFLRSHFAVLGPDIITEDGVHQNPLPNYNWTVESIRKERMRRRVKLLSLQFGIKNSPSFLRKSRVINQNTPAYKQRKLDVPLHGATFVISPEFSLKGLDPNTFLYLEEDILYEQVQSLGLRTVYFPEVHVVHSEDLSTQKLVTDPIERLKLKNKNWIASSYELEKLISQRNEK